MRPRASKNFFRFFFGFVAIIGMAFGILLLTSAQIDNPVDNLAVPQ